MTRLVNIGLLLLVVASALVLVRSAYDARRLFAEIHKAELEALRLEGEFKRLEAERQAQATSLRVERTAREKLAMHTLNPAITMYVVDPQAGPTAARRPADAGAPPSLGTGAAPDADTANVTAGGTR
ncbi:MAG: cell division protein FtsL [Burkholderiaceae bacterium]|jgi:cell division protein FtsL|nr:cell division protein FtsL [Aquabacterium sp.]NUP88070.1 cell division protein FtsL [Burkholderiaceae bacterium]